MNKIFLLLLSVFFSSTLYSQVKKDSLSVLSESDYSKNKISTDSARTNIFKLSPPGILEGKIPLIYERKLTRSLSLQVSVGVTSRDYIRHYWHELLRRRGKEAGVDFHSSGLPEGSSDLSDPLYIYVNRKTRIGYMFSIQPRFYFLKKGLQGVFTGISADVYRYNNSIPAMIVSPNLIGHDGKARFEQENVRDLMVHFGWQKFYSKLNLEYSASMGVRDVKGVKYVAALVNNSIVEGESHYTNTNFTFALGFKIGYLIK